MSEPKEILRAEGITRYFDDPVRFKVLDDVSFSINRGEFISVVGKSGSGKSTLLYVLSTMDTDYEGKLYLDHQLLSGLSGSELAQVRNEKIGFVFQFHYLLNEFSVLQNVAIPAIKLGKWSKSEIEDRAMEHLRILDVADQALKMPNQLSGGQKQRIAIARALINDPLIIMGDEPTGNLDKKNSDTVFDIFKSLAHEKGQTLLVVTHDPEFAQKTDRILEMRDGRL
ncbi:MAG: ABC transporter ATP-binding protein [Flavobacteriales bacterium]|jgi:lipoprotein-releasing system ATP-binding protein